MHEFITTKEAKAALGVSEQTLRRWADINLFPSIRTPGNHRLYCIKQYLQDKQYPGTSITPEQESGTGTGHTKHICYCRVSSLGQKDDLQRQVQYMHQRFPKHRIITDIGSGINFHRRGLQTVLELACKGLLTGGTLVVAHRDRLCRFAFELFERVLRLHEVRIVVLHEDVEASENGELVEDLLFIIHVFSCRINGKRKYLQHTEKKSCNKGQSSSEAGATKRQSQEQTRRQQMHQDSSLSTDARSPE